LFIGDDKKNLPRQAEQRLLPSPNLSPLGRGNGEGTIFIKFKIEKVNIISYAIE
jgi:hypothetical protein